jgi:hypothetical protein
MNGLNEKPKRDGEMFLFGCMHVYGDETLLTERVMVACMDIMEGRYAVAGKHEQKFEFQVPSISRERAPRGYTNLKAYGTTTCATEIQ